MKVAACRPACPHDMSDSVLGQVGNCGARLDVNGILPEIRRGPYASGTFNLAPTLLSLSIHAAVLVSLVSG